MYRKLPSLFPLIRFISGGLAAAACLLAASPVHGQYFGGNKVQYRTFDFEVLHTEHFDVYFYPEERQATELTARMAERWRARLDRVFDHTLRGRQPLILYAAHPHFEQTNAIPGAIGESTGGVTEAIRRRIVLPLAGPLADTDHVLGHEIVHAYQYDITSDREAGGQAGFPGVARLPLWFVEGMAEYLSIGPVDPHTALWMRDAALQEKLPKITDLSNPKYFPYRWGHAFWSYVAGRWGDGIVGTLLREASRAGSPERAIETELGLKVEELTQAWHAALRSAAERVAQRAQPAERFGRVVTPEQAVGGDLNVSPSLSPDGRRVAFLSERSLFSIELYIADAETGEILERVSRTDVDPHFSSLQFINSAGGWSASGDQFAFTVITKGRPTMALYDVARDRIAREVRLDGVDEAFSPTWSPDGRRIAFTGLVGGLTDLFVLDVESGRVERLTSDVFADVQPAWSPDGKSLAFATDRFSTTVETLAIGEYRLALFDVETRQVRPLPSFNGAKHLNPNWGPDSRALYFLSDRGGVTNVYRLDVGTGVVTQSTDLQTGVSGITASSPALSTATKSNRLAFSVYERGAYRVYTSDEPSVIAGVALQQMPDNAGVLPPQERRSDQQIASLLETPTVGLPAGVGTEVTDYSASLQLDAIGQPTIAIGRDQFGTFGGGGIALGFSDMLGDHSVSTVFQINSSFNGDMSVRDIGAAVAYTNLKRRWNWGVFAEQAPYRAGSVGVGTDVINGHPTLLEQTVILRQTGRSVGMGVAYPFNQAQRLEFSAGYRNISFDQQIQTLGYSAITGELLFEESSSESIGESLNFGEATAALVYDTSVFGATSPVLGQRYRLEVSPVAGSLSYTSLLTDYRKYFMPFQFYTLAARVLHYGRYGDGGEDPRLTPLFIGYPTLVRGYDVGSFEASDCGFDPSGACPAFDRLLGSRMLVGNVEFRFPLLRPFGMSSGVYGPIPVEVALFADAGVAWDSLDKPSFAGGNREAVSSAGVALRVNAFGFAIVQLDLVRPFQRPDKGWFFQFSLAPGF
jgi:Tol biopolymer transport system component